ncbi:hypothetical protein EVAR_4649_1 [Eumeta japonica]|uniref:Uncharacterized protein n=1 Tax=Eumeta variegata TaxID=151549 RepID=A0A4C1YEK8_EUMVA|nr:hypothetical protein EVAR_4649_1 [Eumeta japonica]
MTTPFSGRSFCTAGETIHEATCKLYGKFGCAAPGAPGRSRRPPPPAPPPCALIAAFTKLAQTRDRNVWATKAAPEEPPPLQRVALIHRNPLSPRPFRLTATGQTAALRYDYRSPTSVLTVRNA